MSPLRSPPTTMVSKMGWYMIRYNLKVSCLLCSRHTNCFCSSKPSLRQYDAEEDTPLRRMLSLFLPPSPKASSKRVRHNETSASSLHKTSSKYLHTRRRRETSHIFK